MGYVSRDTSPIMGPDDGRSISRNVAHLNILVHDMINLLYYNLRSQTDFAGTNVNITSFGLNSLRYLATKIWDIVPNEIKLAKNLDLFKEKIRKWEPKGCHCRLCKVYVHGVGYIDTF